MDKARAKAINVHVNKTNVKLGPKITVTFQCPICDVGHRIIIKEHGLSMFDIVSSTMTHKIAKADLFKIYIDCECKGCTYQFVWDILKRRYFKWNGTIKYHHRT